MLIFPRENYLKLKHHLKQAIADVVIYKKGFTNVITRVARAKLEQKVVVQKTGYSLKFQPEF
jgi:hypothetical protein